ncbi:MAG: DUF2794 domain-containing protein [Alphaproteobacteria bacterium]
MAQILKISDYESSNLKSKNKQSQAYAAVKVTGNAYKVKKPIFFDREELMTLMGLYSQMVAQSVWRDYALDQLQGQALFSVYKHAKEAPIFMVSKQAGPSGKGREYMAYAGPRRIKRSTDIRDIASALKIHAENN